MGIPSYFAHVLKKYPRVIKRLSELPCINNLYLDCNGMVYDVVRQMQYNPEDQAAYETEMLQRICESIDACIAILRPISSVFIAFDGVAPVAKLNQQRERRYKSWYLGEMEAQRRRDIVKNKNNPTNKYNKGKKASVIEPPKPAWNTSSITPGTKFMNALHDKLAEYYDTTNRAALNARYNLSGAGIIVSSSKEPGEGEHKLFEYIREHAAEHANMTTIIYGLDADLIMLCMSHLHISRGIYLYRETPEFVKSINATLDEKERYFMDIPEFADAIWGALVATARPCLCAPHTPNGALIPTITHLEGGVRGQRLLRGTHGSPMDYIFMCFMLGNDFMPHFPALNIRTTGIASLMEAYRATIGPDETIIQTTPLGEYAIHWPNYKKLVAHLAAQELTLIRKEHTTRDRQARHMRDSDRGDDVMHDVLMLPMTQRDVERDINPFQPGWENRYYAALCDMHGAIDPPAIASLCRNYLQGMEWTFRYYTRGCVDWKWTYANHYPPLLADLVHHIPETHDPANAFSFLSIKPKEPIRDVVQLCYVLPRSSHALLPPSVERALMRSRIGHKYTDNGSHNFKWAYCKYFWECHTELPPLDLRELEQITET